MPSSSRRSRCRQGEQPRGVALLRGQQRRREWGQLGVVQPAWIAVSTTPEWPAGLRGCRRVFRGWRAPAAGSAPLTAPSGDRGLRGRQQGLDELARLGAEGAAGDEAGAVGRERVNPASTAPRPSAWVRCRVGVDGASGPSPEPCREELGVGGAERRAVGVAEVVQLLVADRCRSGPVPRGVDGVEGAEGAASYSAEQASATSWARAKPRRVLGARRPWLGGDDLLLQVVGDALTGVDSRPRAGRTRPGRTAAAPRPQPQRQTERGSAPEAPARRG